MRDRAICWFKSGPSPCSRRIWELARLLERHGEHTAIVKSRRPGYVVHEDAHQVAAVPFRDTFSRR